MSGNSSPRKPSFAQRLRYLAVDSLDFLRDRKGTVVYGVAALATGSINELRYGLFDGGFLEYVGDFFGSHETTITQNHYAGTENRLGGASEDIPTPDSLQRPVPSSEIPDPAVREPIDTPDPIELPDQPVIETPGISESPEYSPITSPAYKPGNTDVAPTASASNMNSGMPEGDFNPETHERKLPWGWLSVVGGASVAAAYVLSRKEKK